MIRVKSTWTLPETLKSYETVLPTVIGGLGKASKGVIKGVKEIEIGERIKKVELANLVEGDPKVPFSIATSPRCRGGRYSIL